MKRLIISLLLGSSFLYGCSKGVEFYNHGLNNEELKIVENCFKDYEIKDMKVVATKYENNEQNGDGHVYFFDCYGSNLKTLIDMEYKLEEVEKIINNKLDALYTSILLKDIKEFKLKGDL